MAAFSNCLGELLRLILPGILADRDHWRARAMGAEARLAELISQIDSTLAREREEWRSERIYLLDRLGGEYPLPPPPSADDRDGQRGRVSIPIANPIARAYAAAKRASEKIPEELVEGIVDDYLRMNAMNAANGTDNHNDRGK